MSKVQEYLKRKKIYELGLPKLYIVTSSPVSVETPIEMQVIEIIKNIISVNGEKKIINKYIIENYPYEIEIIENETFSSVSGYGTGFGDLWSWTYFSTFSKEDSEKYYYDELNRVKNKYLKK